MNNQRIDEFLSNADVLLNRLKSGELPNNDKINLYVFGQSYQNLLKIILEAFSIMPQFHIDGFFVKGCKCNLLYGETAKFYQVEPSEKKEVDFPYISNLLSQFDNTKNHLKFDFITNSEVAKKFNIHIIISENDYSEVEWNNVLKDADFIFFTLTSTALLSICERKILRSTLLPNMGNDLGVLLTNYNMVLFDDRILIDTSLARMFEGYETPIFRFPEENEEKFVKYLINMPEIVDGLHKRRKNRCKKIVLNELLHELNLQIEVLFSDNAKLDDVIELLNERLQKLPDRKESAFRRARMKYTSKLRIELAKAVSYFHQQFEETLEKEIASNDDIDELQSILSDYIRSQWENEAVILNNHIKEFTESIDIGLKDYINDDITSYIKDGVSEDFASYVFGLTNMYLQQPDNVKHTVQVQDFDFELKKDKSNLTKYGVVASGIALVLMSHPIVGVTVAVLGSKKVAQISKKQFVATSKQALLDAAKEMCIYFRNEMDLWIDQATNHIESHLESCIGKCYQNVIDLMIEAVKEKQRGFTDHNDEIEKLNQLKIKIENELK